MLDAGGGVWGMKLGGGLGNGVLQQAQWGEQAVWEI